MESENIFSTTKEYFEAAFNNYEHFQKQNKKVLALFAEQLKKGNTNLDKLVTEWQVGTEKAFKDYRELFLKGLDYLAGILEKNTKDQHIMEKRTKSPAA